jgi:hypothetical protein
MIYLRLFAAKYSSWTNRRRAGPHLSKDRSYRIRVGGARALEQALGRHLEQRVAGGVAQAVVDRSDIVRSLDQMATKGDNRIL